MYFLYLKKKNTHRYTGAFEKLFAFSIFHICEVVTLNDGCALRNRMFACTVQLAPGTGTQNRSNSLRDS